MIPGVEILAPLSAGGMGEVLLGRRHGAHGFEKLVAVKKIRADLIDRPDVRAMFLDEARLLSRISHPAIAHVLDFGEDAGSLYIVMEYVDGVSFFELIEKDGDSLGPALAAKLIAEVCRGLHAAHELADLDGRPFNIVHRDVTPENLVLGFDGGVKILDFGIALMRDRVAPVTQIGAIRGKIAYLAPEQQRGEAIDRRTDIYGASAVLFELILGRRSFPDRSPQLPCAPLLRALVDRGLSPNRDARFQDAREMAEALERAASELGGESLEAFAERVLAKQRREHEAKLKSIFEGERTATQRPPVSGRVTEADAPAATALQPTYIPTRPERRNIALYLGTGIAAAVIAALFIATRESDPVVTPLEPPPQLVRVEATKPKPEPEPEKEPKKTNPAQKRSKTHIEAPAIKEATPQAQPAWLTIGANPYALVSIDGKQVGPTPIVDLALPSGPHQLRAVEPDTDRVRFDQTITIDPGQHKTVTVR